MNRRHLLKNLLGFATTLPIQRLPQAQSKPEKTLQHSPVAGFQYYQGERIWPQLKLGQTIRLHRETDNAYDKQAVALYWRDYKLGFIPRRQNFTIAQLLDQQQPLTGRIHQLSQSRNPWKRIEIEILWS